MEKDIVIFRIWRIDGEDELIALFPEQEGSEIGLVGSFQHIGQHGDADYFMIIQHSRPAKPNEYEDLKRELEDNYGYNLRVVKRGAQYLWWRE